MSTCIWSLSAGCRRGASHYAPGAAPPTPAEVEAQLRTDGGSAPDIIPDSFNALYPIVLLRKVDPIQKAQIWSRYQGRWVRWTGKVISITRDGFTVRMSPDTVTFDVSVSVDAGEKSRLAEVRPGDRVTYLGRLVSFDDIFRTLYLNHGSAVLVEPEAAKPDGGP